MTHAADEVVEVDDCSSDTQLRSKLGAMQQGTGGTLTFACGDMPPPIVLTGGRLPRITKVTTIDGGNKVVLSGNNATRILFVDFGGELTLRRIALANASDANTDGGAVYNGGTLILDGVHIADSKAVGWSGGAIFSASGSRLVVAGSTFSRNEAVNGGAIFAFNGVQLEMTDSTLNSNRATGQTAGSGWGGALLLWDGADATIERTFFINNRAREGGALQSMFESSDLVVRRTAFLDNQAQNGSGGAIRLGPADNVGSGSHVQLTEVAISNNEASGTVLASGGGIYGEASSLRMAGVTLAQNTAANRGGAIYFVNARFPDLSIINSTLYDNSASLEGGAIYVASGAGSLDDVSLGNVTIGRNSAGSGGGLANSALLSARLSLTNVLFDLNENGNCLFPSPPSMPESNLSSDLTCGFGAGRDDLDLRLGPLADNGGFTWTQLPFPGSPAIDAGYRPFCLEFDQRGAPRPFGAFCDVGAVEFGATVPTTTITTPTSTTLPPNTCGTECVTTDPCRPRTCVAGACLAQDLAGLTGASCACERLAPAACANQVPPGKVARAVAKACSLLDAATAGEPGTRRVRKQLVKAGRKWRAASRLVFKRAARRVLTPECIASLEADYDNASDRVDAVLEAADGDDAAK
jgi:predicted outer membrane repeat protein